MVKQSIEDTRRGNNNIPITGQPNLEQLGKALNDEVYYRELCQRYGAAEMEQWMSTFLNSRP
ncbi:hypothetical protein ACED51_10535 [Photobacterium swingsii]